MAEKEKKKNMTLDADAHAQLIKKERRANNVWNKLRRNKTAMIGLTIVVVMIVLALFAPLIATHDPNAIKPSETYLGLGENGHIFGTDEFGRDLFSRVVYGARISLIAAIGGRSDRNHPWIDRRIYGRRSGCGHHAFNGWYAGFSFCFAGHYPHDNFRIRTAECYFGYWNRKCSKLLPRSPGTGTYCKK